MAFNQYKILDGNDGEDMVRIRTSENINNSYMAETVIEMTMNIQEDISDWGLILDDMVKNMPENKLSGPMSKYLAKQIKKMRKMQTRSLYRTLDLKTKLEEEPVEKNKDGTEIREILSSIDKVEENRKEATEIHLRLAERMGTSLVDLARIIAGMENEIKDDIKKVTDSVNEMKRGIVVAQKERSDEREMEQATWATVAAKPKRAWPRLVVEQDDRSMNRKNSRKLLEEAILGTEGHVKVRGIKELGGVFSVEVHDEIEVEKLRSGGLMKKGFRLAEPPKERDIRLLVYDVEHEMTAEDLLKAFTLRNEDCTEKMTEEEVKNNFRPRFKLGRMKGTSHWVVDTSSELGKLILNKGRIYVGLRSCKVKRYVSVTRCYKCQGFGHTSRVCKNGVACSRCGREGHHSTGCKTTSGGVECVNCRRAGHGRAQHYVGDPNCPTYVKRKKAEEARLMVRVATPPGGGSGTY